VLARIQALVAQGAAEAALEVFFREVVRMPEDELARFRALPAWNARVALAPTIARETLEEERYRFEPDRFATFRVLFLREVRTFLRNRV
jgi:hypothetical protein